MKFEEVIKIRSFLTAVGIRFISNFFHSETYPEQPFILDEPSTEFIRSRAAYLYQYV
jgi:hypothetical protein